MVTEKIIESRVLELSNTVSDLLVGLHCQDAPEVLRKSLLLKSLANEYGATSLAKSAEAMGQTVEMGYLDTANLLEPELLGHLRQNVKLMRQLISAT